MLSIILLLSSLLFSLIPINFGLFMFKVPNWSLSIVLLLFLKFKIIEFTFEFSPWFIVDVSILLFSFKSIELLFSSWIILKKIAFFSFNLL